jgi:uncharacterized membrane protein/DNA-binding MarR family transcriptional regulator
MRRLLTSAVVLIFALILAAGSLANLSYGHQAPTRADGTIDLIPDPADEISPTGSPVKHGVPGEDVVFNILVKNTFEREQRVIFTINDGPSWLIAVRGSIDVPSNTTAKATVTASIPDSILDPDATYAILVDGIGNITGDRDSLLLIIELDIIIDHELVISPYNEDEWTFKVYPGERTFVDLTLSNLGNMKGRYELRTGPHSSDWDIQFREGEEVLSIELDHGETGANYYTRLLIGVPASSSPGDKVALAVNSRSVDADEFSTGRASDTVTLNFEVIKGSMVTISPLKTMTTGEDYVDVSYQLHHSGVVDAVLDFLPSIYQDGNIQSGWDFTIAPADPLLIKVGETREIQVRAVAPDAAFGYYDLIMDAVSNSADIIAGESVLYIVPRSSITLDEINGGPFIEGEDIELTTVVSNNGDLSRQVVLEVSGVPEIYTIDVKPSMNLNIPPGQQVTVTLTLHTMEVGPLDPFEISITVLSPSDEIGSEWEQVAQVKRDINYMDLPNLEVRRIHISEPVTVEGREIYVNVTVANIGNVPVQTVDVILIEVSQKFSNKEFTRNTTSLQPGEVKTLSFRWTARVSARSIRAEVNSTISIKEIETDDNWMLEQVYVDPINDRPIQSSERDEGIFTPETAAVGGLGLGILGAILVFFGSKDLFRYPFFLAIGPLYSKLKPEHLLNNRLRKRIYVYVQNHPGEHFRSILTHLNLTNGTLAHHLYTLEKENLIRSQRDGLYRRFYPAGYQIDPGHISLTSIQQRIMDLVKEEPGLSQKEISQKLELSNSTVN